MKHPTAPGGLESNTRALVYQARQHTIDALLQLGILHQDVSLCLENQQDVQAPTGNEEPTS
ncbi:hypothetical protein SAMN05216577_1283 [Pseudomonas citronellolis]|uniref:Uncharacterized protein n=1 Tax=Pseudomonas citronellolis TaxID=53408 RepID=A0AAQ1KJ05_9PSED|nr:hypothetical protein [Pseudomonas citronellolis]TGC32397.1 hypothetical protein CW310_01880 [Pseudomonas citronellolis]SFD51575.1 hypothetical protein SAMN05216577_1283 [Pseudomonas citronellolis]